MSAGSVSRRYARALFSLADEQGQLDRAGRELASLAEVMDASEDLREALSNPAFAKDERRKILGAILGRLGASTTVNHLCQLLLDRERLSEVPGIARAMADMVDERMGRVHADVVSATKLSPDHESRLKGELEKLSGSKVEMTTSEDHELLGGVVAKVGDVIYDGSLKTQLARMKDQLAQ